MNEQEFWKSVEGKKLTDEDYQLLKKIRRNKRQDDWKKNSQDRVDIRLPKGYKQRILAECNRLGLDMTNYIKQLLDKNLPPV